MENKDTYFVAVKVFLLDTKENLLIIKDRFGDWDIPGGRLRDQDFDIPLESIVERKMIEEIGENVKYKLGAPVVFMRHERDEILSSDHREKRRIFAIGYIAKYKEGEIMLGKNHTEHEWVPIETFDAKSKFTGGWLQGIKDFQNKYKELLFSVLLITLSLTLSACSVTGKAAVVDTAIIPFTDHKSCVKMCQDNFCEVSIEGQASCLQQGFDSCQKSCDLRFKK